MAPNPFVLITLFLIILTLWLTAIIMSARAGWFYWKSRSDESEKETYFSKMKRSLLYASAATFGILIYRFTFGLPS